MATTHYRWNPVTDNVLCEQDAAGSLTAAYTHEPEFHGDIVSQERAGQDSYFHFDGQGTTRQLTLNDGTVSDSYSYTVFGEEIERSGMTVNPFAFKGALGYYTMPETGHLSLDSRLYVPNLARFMSILAGRKFNTYSTSSSMFEEAGPNQEAPPQPPPDFKGCKPEEVKAIRAAFFKLCKQVFPRCMVRTGLMACVKALCGQTGDVNWDVECKKCEMEDTGGMTDIHDLACKGRKDWCKPAHPAKTKIIFCQGDDGTVPHPGYTLEIIWLHEMLHNCCMKHEPNSPEWQKKIFNACILKCLESPAPGAEAKDCKCPAC